jgi:hypothetical protein
MKPGVRPNEHAVIYTQGSSPQLLPGEIGITKSPIMVVQDQANSPLHAASRLYFGVHHPIQYNVKVKDLGRVAETDLPRLRMYWSMVNQEVSNQEQGLETTGMKTTNMSTSDMEMSEEEDASDEDSNDEEASNVKMTNVQTTGLTAPVSSQVFGLSNTIDNGRISTAARRSPESKSLPEQDISISFVERLERLNATVRLDSGKTANIEQGLN